MARTPKKTLKVPSKGRKSTWKNISTGKESSSKRYKRK